MIAIWWAQVKFWIQLDWYQTRQKWFPSSLPKFREILKNFPEDSFRM